MRITASTDAGMRHDKNQDCYKAGRLSDDSYWMVLCDGMGGVSSGGEASFIAVNCLEQAISDALLDLQNEQSVKEFMLGAVARCNRLIHDLSADEGNSLTMGTTVVMAIVRNGIAQIVHAGDSRAYRLTKRSIEQLTIDHSVVQELLESGKITEQQARNHPNKNIITSALGVDSEIRIDYNETKLVKGDVLLLCTDGLSNMMEDSEIVNVVKSTEFYRTAENLVKRAVDLGGFDNVTAIVLAVE